MLLSLDPGSWMGAIGDFGSGGGGRVVGVFELGLAFGILGGIGGGYYLHWVGHKSNDLA